VSHLCNYCGKTEAVYPFVVSGEIDSRLLFEERTYSFRLCEACLVSWMAKLSSPPEVLDSDSGQVTWESDRAMRRAQTQAWEEEQAAIAKAKNEGRCTVIVRHEWGEPPQAATDKPGPCGKTAVLHGFYEGSDLPHHAYCARHGRDAYADASITLYGGGRTVTPADRRRLKTEYLAAFAARRKIEPRDEHEAATFITVLCTLVAKVETVGWAAEELTRLIGCRDLPEADAWIDSRIACAFRPGADMGRVANDWLVYARSQGYVNAAAAPCVGYGLDMLWPEEETS
jgi:hypothetical protein